MDADDHISLWRLINVKVGHQSFMHALVPCLYEWIKA